MQLSCLVDDEAAWRVFWCGCLVDDKVMWLVWWCRCPVSSSYGFTWSVGMQLSQLVVDVVDCEPFEGDGTAVSLLRPRCGVLGLLVQLCSFSDGTMSSWVSWCNRVVATSTRQ